MGNTSKILLVLLIGSIVLNISILVKLGDIEEQAENNDSHMTSQVNGLQNTLRSLDRRLDEWEEKQEWIVSTSFEPLVEQSNPDNIHLNIEWSFRTVERDAAVFLFYRSESKVWKRVAAEKVDGQYEAAVSLSPDRSYEYKIIAEGERTVSSDVQPIPHRYYKPAPVVPKGIGHGESGGQITHISVNLEQIEEPIFDFYEPEKMEIIFYHNKEVIIKKMLPPKDGKRNWDVEVRELDENPTSVYLKVTYKDGRITEGEIWPKQKYEEFLFDSKKK